MQAVRSRQIRIVRAFLCFSESPELVPVGSQLFVAKELSSTYERVPPTYPVDISESFYLGS